MSDVVVYLAGVFDAVGEMSLVSSRQKTFLMLKVRVPSYEVAFLFERTFDAGEVRSVKNSAGTFWVWEAKRAPAANAYRQMRPHLRMKKAGPE
jgi:hypothetical protein